MTSSLRKATDADLEVLLELAEECVQGPKWSRSSWEETLRSAGSERPSRAVLVMAMGERPVGFGVIHLVDQVGEIETLGVLNGVRRLGLGKELCRDMVEWARAAGLEGVQLEVRSRNVPARALYEQLGFKVQGERRSYYSEPEDDAVLMGISFGV